MNRSTWLKVVNSFYWLFLALWMGALVTTAAFAAITFPTLRDVGVIVPQYETIPIDEHFLIAAGSVMERAFFFLDLVQLCSAVVVAVGLGLHLTVFGMPRLRPANLIRILAIGASCLLVSYQVMVLGPRMHANLVQYRQLALEGQDYSAPRDAFDADHPTSTRIMGATLLAVALTVVSSATALTTREDDQPSTGPSGGLPEPELLRRRPL